MSLRMVIFVEKNFSFRQPQTKHGFSLVELLAILAIITLLSALLMPALKSARSQARSTACMANLRQIGIAESLYCSENQNCFAPAYTWQINLKAYVAGKNTSSKNYGIAGIFLCPELGARPGWSTNSPPLFSYFLNYRMQHSEWAYHRAVVPNAAQMMLMGDAEAGTVQFMCAPDTPNIVGGWCHYPEFRHHGRSNILFVDGHIEGILSIPSDAVGTAPNAWRWL